MSLFLRRLLRSLISFLLHLLLLIFVFFDLLFTTLATLPIMGRVAECRGPRPPSDVEGRPDSLFLVEHGAVFFVCSSLSLSRFDDGLFQWRFTFHTIDVVVVFSLSYFIS